jgi:hypothetical protein
MKPDFINTYKCWVWMAKTGRNKEDWPKYNKIQHLFVSCAFCHYSNCTDCPLNDSVCDRLYHKWVNAKYESESKKQYAAAIRDEIYKYLFEKGLIK